MPALRSITGIVLCHSRIRRIQSVITFFTPNPIYIRMIQGILYTLITMVACILTSGDGVSKRHFGKSNPKSKKENFKKD